jgi:hypothetical protein
MTTNLLTASMRTLADLTANFAYPHSTIDDLRDYFRAELMIPTDATIDSRADLFDALDRDINDMIHNCNLDMLFPSYDIDMLDDLNPDATDDTHDLLADRIDDSRFIALLTRRIADRLL